MAYQNKNEKAEAQKYEVVKIWREDLKEYLDLNAIVRTKLVDGRLQVALELDGFPAYLSHPRLQARNRDANILLSFEDKDGFKVYERVLKISEFSSTVDPKGNKTGLNHQFEDYIGVNKYKSFARLAFRWTLVTIIPAEPKVATAPTPRPKVSNESDDHCAPGLSKEARLGRLAKHGVVRQTREDTYTVGHREVTFYPQSIGGGMLACR